jgi:hypothetical protein
VTRNRWIAVVALAAGLSSWLLVFYWGALWPNLAASVIWGTPALSMHHVAIRRRQDRQHAEQVGRQEAQAEQLGVVAAKVGELHDLSIEGHLPARILKP